jgi:hypothetical protein
METGDLFRRTDMADTHHIRPVLDQLTGKTTHEHVHHHSALSHLHVAHTELGFEHVHEAHSDNHAGME